MQHTNGNGTSRASEKDSFHPDIEGLLGITVMLVVLFHAGLLSNAGIHPRDGFIGVDLRPGRSHRG